MNKGTFFRRKEGRLYFVWINSLGKERCKVIGDASLSDAEGGIRVGERGLDRLAHKPDPVNATFGDVLDQYIAYGKTKTGKPKAESTKEVEARNARLYVRPQWAKRVAKDIEPLEIQAWLDSLGLADRNKIKSLMSAVYRHGQKYGAIPRNQECNPIKWVSCSTVSDYEAITLAPEQAFAVVEQIKDPLVRTLVVLIAITALRISEALGLRWSDIDWKKALIRVNRAWVHSSFGPPKSKASRAPVPMHEYLVATLEAWRRETPYAQDDDLMCSRHRARHRVLRPCSSKTMCARLRLPLV